MEELFKMQSVIKKVDEEKREVTSVISTETEDRDKDIIEVRGWDLKNYKKNPVVLWGHNYSRPPIARTIKIIKDSVKKELIATRQYPEEGIYPFADTVFNLVSGGFQRTVSVGFKPTKWIRRDQLPENHPHFVEGNPDAYYSDTGVLFQKQELLEYSDVPIPANPEALNLAYKKGLMDKKTFEELQAIPCYSCPKAMKGLCTPDKECMSIIKNGCKSETDNQKIFKGWDKGKECEIVDVEEKQKMKWDREKALESLRGYADNGLAFAWKSGEGNSSKDFKLIHHYVEDHTLKVSPEGVESALKCLNDKRSKSIPAEDREQVYDHLVEHLKVLVSDDVEIISFEMVEKNFKSNMSETFSDSMQEGIEDLARKLDIVGENPAQVLAKAFDELRTKAVVVKFASLEPAIKALEADLNSIDTDGKTIDDEHKALFKRLVDIMGIIKGKGFTDHVDEVSDITEKPPTETKEPTFIDELKNIEKVLDETAETILHPDGVGDSVDKVLEDLHDKEKVPTNMEDVEKALDDLDNSVQD